MDMSIIKNTRRKLLYMNITLKCIHPQTSIQSITSVSHQSNLKNISKTTPFLLQLDDKVDSLDQWQICVWQPTVTPPIITIGTTATVTITTIIFTISFSNVIFTNNNAISKSTLNVTEQVDGNSKQISRVDNVDSVTSFVSVSNRRVSQ